MPNTDLEMCYRFFYKNNKCEPLQRNAILLLFNNIDTPRTIAKHPAAFESCKGLHCKLPKFGIEIF